MEISSDESILIFKSKRDYLNVYYKKKNQNFFKKKTQKDFKIE